MRLHKSRFVPLALFSSAIFLTGCAEVNGTIDKAQACLEAPKIVTELVGKAGQLVNDPAALDKALDESATKLNDVADKAANTTLKEASNDLATTLSGLSVKNANDAVDAVQKVGTETTAYLEQVAKACS